MLFTPRMASLDLTGRQLSTIPKDVFDYTELIEVWFDDNQLREIPEDIACLTQLKRLSAYKNHLDTLPAAIFEMANLHCHLP